MICPDASRYQTPTVVQADLQPGIQDRCLNAARRDDFSTLAPHYFPMSGFLQLALAFAVGSGLH